MAIAKFSSARPRVEVHLAQYPASIRARPRTSDVPTFEKVFIFGEYDFPYPIEAPGLIIDAGANVGYATVFFANRYPSSTVLAVEPEQSNYEILRQNTEAYPNVQALRSALWSTNAPLRIENPSADFWEFRVSLAGEAGPDICTSVTVPQLMAMAHSETVDILKIDIEGAEKELFETGADAWLNRVRVIVIELHDRIRSGCSTSFYRATSQLSFNQFTMGENVVLVRND